MSQTQHQLKYLIRQPRTYRHLQLPLHHNKAQIPRSPFRPSVWITQGFKDDTWGFATITLSGADADGHLPGKYGVELDLNKDGRGHWLIIASSPSSATWTIEGVQAWKDSDGDVGGRTPIFADKPAGGDGYETLVFDQGKGDNADGAWVQIAPDDPKTVILAFKLSMLGDPKSFALGAWAGADSLNPAIFDLNDHMTHQDAGSPLPGLKVYPLKGLSEVDNTCRLAIGFSATDKVPGLCGIPKAPGSPGCPNSCPYGQNPYPDCACWPG